MKKYLVTLSLTVLMLSSIDAQSQQKLNEWLKTKKEEAKTKVNTKIDQKSSAGIDNALNKPEEMIKKKQEKKKANKSKVKNEVEKETASNEVEKETVTNKVVKETNTERINKFTEKTVANTPTKEEADPLADPNDPYYYKNHPVIKTNIKCEAGKAKMLKVLKDLDGVFEVKINSKTGMLNLHYSDGGTSLKDIVEEINANGFDVLSVYDGDRDSELKKTTKPSANLCKK